MLVIDQLEHFLRIHVKIGAKQVQVADAHIPYFFQEAVETVEMDTQIRRNCCLGYIHKNLFELSDMPRFN